MIGQRFGKLVVITNDVSRKYHVVCKCDCGNTKSINRYTLLNGGISCGCIKRERIIRQSYKHGLSGSKLHRIWSSMRERCTNNKNKSWHCYGGRGIKVCLEWDNYMNFHKWSMANGYKPGLTLDRKNNNLGYNPENCRWVTHKINSWNNRLCKINYEDAQSMRELFASGTSREALIEKFKLNRSTINRILTNKNWVAD